MERSLLFTSLHSEGTDTEGTDTEGTDIEGTDIEGTDRQNRKIKRLKHEAI